LGDDNCDSMASCQNKPGSFDCVCNLGYLGNGTVCTGKKLLKKKKMTKIKIQISKINHRCGWMSWWRRWK